MTSAQLKRAKMLLEKQLMASVEKAYANKSPQRAAKQAREVASRLQQSSPAKSKGLKKVAEEIIDPPKLEASYLADAKERLGKYVSSAAAISFLINRQNSVERKAVGGAFLRDLKEFNQWFGVIDDGLKDDPQAQAKEAAARLLKVAQKGNEILFIMDGWRVFNVRKASLILDSHGLLALDISTRGKAAHRAKPSKFYTYANKNNIPLYRVKGTWIGVAGSFFSLSSKKVRSAVLIHEFVHASNNEKDMTKTCGGHYAVNNVDFSESSVALTPAQAIDNPTSWSALIAGENIESREGCP